MDLLKRIVFSVLALSVPAFCDQIASSQFKGINNNENSVIIDSSYAQDLLNVDVTPGGKSVKKRSGYSLFKTLGSNQPIHGGFHAFDSSNSDYQIWGSSRSLYSIKNSSVTQLVSSSTLNATWDCADTQGYSYCVNSSRDAVIRTDGSTISWSTTTLGTMIESTPDRVVIAGVSGSPNTLYVSQSNTFTNFTTGVNATDAFTEVIASPGSALTHIRWGCGKLLWWKDQSMGYFDFDDQYTAQVKTVSDTIGTLDNSSAIDPSGRVWFRGQDGHSWLYDCSFLTKMSVDISPFATSAGRVISNSWIMSSGSDFDSGSFGTGIDTITVSGQVSLAGRSDSFSDLSGWAQSASGNWFASGNTAYYNYTSNYQKLISATTIPNLSTAAIRSQVYAKVPSTSYAAPVTASVGLVNTSTQGYVASFFTNDGNVSVQFSKIQGAINNSNPAGSVTATVDSTPVFDTTTYHTLMFQFEQNSGNLFAYFDDTLVAHGNDTTYTNMAKQYIGGLSDTVGHNIPLFQSATVVSLFGTYYSPVHNAPSITSWGALNLSTFGFDSRYSLRSSTNSFTVLSTTPSWTIQSSGDIISISTGTYFQFKAVFDVSDFNETVASHILYSSLVNWFEGAFSTQSFLIYFDNAIWESVSFGPGQTISNYIFKYDLINEGWTIYSFGTGGMLIQSNILYFGDPNDDNIFSFGSSTSDDGSSISAYWKSKDFSGADPFLSTQLTNIDTFFKRNQGATVTSAYTVDTSSTTSYSVSLSNASKDIIQSRKLLPSGKMGQVFNIKYSDNSDSSAWELLGYRIGFLQQPYRPN